MSKKKVICGVLAVVMGLAVSNIALARTANSNLCNLTYKALQRDGFSNHAIYRVDAIKQLLQRAGVNADLTAWDPNQLYQLSYSCKMQHGVTYAGFVATPVTNVAPTNLPGEQTVTATVTPGVIAWDATPPAP